MLVLTFLGIALTHGKAIVNVSLDFSIQINHGTFCDLQQQKETSCLNIFHGILSFVFPSPNKIDLI